MLSASAAPRWKRQMSTFPFCGVGIPCAYTMRFRNDGESPIVTSASAPDLRKTRRCMSLPPLKFGSAEREPDHVFESIELGRRRRAVARHRVHAALEHLPRIQRCLAAENRMDDAVDLRAVRERLQLRAVRPLHERGARQSPCRKDEPEVDARKDGAGVNPRVAALGIAVRREMPVQRLSESR